jgi:hypothetical protein
LHYAQVNVMEADIRDRRELLGLFLNREGKLACLGDRSGVIPINSQR